VSPFRAGHPTKMDSWNICDRIEEATIAVELLVDAWTSTPGAIFWLNTRRRQAKAPGGKRQKSSKA
jgi:hypothetical protein